MHVNHHRDCDFHTDQYNHECTCGATRPKHPDFDKHVERAEALRCLMRREAPLEH